MVEALGYILDTLYINLPPTLLEGAVFAYLILLIMMSYLSNKRMTIERLGIGRATRATRISRADQGASPATAARECEGWGQASPMGSNTQRQA